METSTAMPTLQEDFLDVKAALCEVAASPRMAAACCLLTAFACAQGAALSVKLANASIFWSIPDMAFLLCTLLSCLGGWLLYNEGRRGQLKKAAFGLTRVLPVCCLCIAVLLLLVSLSALIVVAFSGSMVQQSLGNMSATLSGTYYLFLAGVLSALSNTAFAVLCIVTALCFAAILLLSLRFFVLDRLLKRLCAQALSGLPERAHMGYACGASWVFGVLGVALGAFMLPTNPTAGACVALFGATAFASGLVLSRAGAEVNFLCTYYDKLNRSLQKRADALKAAEANRPPLAIPAPSAPSGEDVAGACADAASALDASEGVADAPAHVAEDAPPAVIHLPPTEPTAGAPVAPSAPDVSDAPPMAENAPPQEEA